MNHNFTKEREFKMYAGEYLGNHTAMFFAEEVPQFDDLNGRAGIRMPDAIPDPQIVRNILNYSRSLEVLKPTAGPALFLLKN